MHLASSDASKATFINTLSRRRCKLRHVSAKGATTVSSCLDLCGEQKDGTAKLHFRSGLTTE